MKAWIIRALSLLLLASCLSGCGPDTSVEAPANPDQQPSAAPAANKATPLPAKGP